MAGKKAQFTFLDGQDHGLMVGKDTHLTVMGRNHQRLTVSIIENMVAGNYFQPKCRHIRAPFYVSANP